MPSSSVVVRKPSLILPLACRIPGVQAKGPAHRLNIPTEKKVFGLVAFSIKLDLPGEGPFGNFTRAPRLLDTRTRVRRDAEPPLQSANTSLEAESRLKLLYLTVISNCTTARAEMVVSNCIQSETGDFAKYSTIIHQGSVMVGCHFLDYYSIKTKVGSVHELLPPPPSSFRCLSSSATAEVVIADSASKVYRLDLSDRKTESVVCGADGVS